MSDLARLETETINPRTADLDRVATEDLVRILHKENDTVAEAVEKTLPVVALVVDLLAERLKVGGRLFYVGAGTSGRLGVLDASECPPTFGVDAEMVQGIIAGGATALTNSIEGAEDSPETGATDLLARGVGSKDLVVGIAASGRTPYVVGALDAARGQGAVTVALVNVTDSLLARHADHALVAVTGPESLTGSTRLKAGTAQKMILNLLTTALMVRLGKVYGNLMVDLRATNVKLRDRAIRIVRAATGATEDDARVALLAADWRCKISIVMLKRHVSAEDAQRLLDEADGWVRLALGEEIVSGE